MYQPSSHFQQCYEFSVFLNITPNANVIYSVVTGTFSNTMKFIVKDCDPNTGEADEEGYNDEYVVCGRIICVFHWFLKILSRDVV